MAKENITSRVIDISQFRSLVANLDDTQSWLSSVGESQKVFTDMMNDPRIESLIDDRKNRVLQMDSSQNDSGNKAIDEACRSILDFSLIGRLERVLLNAIPYGLACCEILWRLEGGLYVPYDFIPIPRTAIKFPSFSGDYGVPYLTEGDTRLDNRFHFIIHKNDSGDGNLWGTPALRSSYWPWKFKRLGMKFWIMAAERIGVPSVLALFECKTETETKKRAQDLAHMLTAVESGSSGALGNVTDIKIIESAIQDFDTIICVCNTEIAYGITGQALATNEAQYGTRAQANVHEITYDSKTAGDAYLIQTTIQKLYDSFVEVNFPGQAAPKFDIDSSDYASWATVREAIDRGVPVSLAAIYEKNHVPKPVSEADAFVKQEGGFTFSDDFFLPSRKRLT